MLSEAFCMTASCCETRPPSSPHHCQSLPQCAATGYQGKQWDGQNQGAFWMGEMSRIPQGWGKHPGILNLIPSRTPGRGGEAFHHAAPLPTPPGTSRLSGQAGSDRDARLSGCLVHEPPLASGQLSQHSSSVFPTRKNFPFSIVHPALGRESVLSTKFCLSPRFNG